MAFGYKSSARTQALTSHALSVLGKGDNNCAEVLAAEVVQSNAAMLMSSNIMMVVTSIVAANPVLHHTGKENSACGTRVREARLP